MVPPARARKVGPDEAERLATSGGIASKDPLSEAALRGRVLLSVILGIAVLGALVGFADVAQLLATARRFAWPLLAPVLGLTLANYGIRFLKWKLFLRQVGIRDLEARQSLGIFLAGFTMLMTPRKVGEFLKAYFISQNTVRASHAELPSSSPSG